MDGGKPLRNQECRIFGADDPTPEHTDDNGVISLVVSVCVQHVRIYLPKVNAAFDLMIGALDPVSTLSGIRGRLANLGYYHDSDPGSEEGSGNSIDMSVRGFCLAHQCGDTRSQAADLAERIKREHGC